MLLLSQQTSEHLVQQHAAVSVVATRCHCNPSLLTEDKCPTEGHLWKLIYFLSFQVLLLLMDTVGHHLMHFFEFFKD